MSGHATLYDVHRPRKPSRRRSSMARLRERFVTGVPLGFVWWTPTTCATWRVWRPANRLCHPSAVN